MLSHLARETKPHHATADADRLAIMEQPTRDRYRTFLAQIYCFEAPLEAAVIATQGVDPSLVRTHLKTHRLAGDLEALGFAPRDALPLERMQLDGVPEALGWLWVLHRNTLVHGLIYRYLCGPLGETMTVAGAYFSAFEGRAGGLMRELGERLDDIARRTSIADRVVASAKEAFRLQRQWYSCSLLSRVRPPQPRVTVPVRAA